MFSEIATLINTHGEVGPLLDTVARHTSQLLDAPLVYVALADQHGAFALSDNGHVGVSDHFIRSFRTVPGHGLHHQAIEARGPIATPDMQVDPRAINPVVRGEGWRAVLISPMIAGDRVVGILCAGRKEVRDWPPEEIETMRFMASQAAAAIDRARTLDDLRALDKLKDEILSIASHELRTPLTAIKGFAAILAADRGDLDADALRKYAKIIDDESDRMIRLVDDMLNVSRIESGRVALEMQAVGVLEMVERAVFASWGPDRGHIEVDIDESIDVRGDADNLVRILANLLENARKYSVPGARVSVAARQGDAQVEIRVWNEGETLTPDDVDLLFRKFSRLNRHRASGSRGAGLGLYIARQLIAAMGGRLWVEPTPGGPTFAFSLPVP